MSGLLAHASISGRHRLGLLGVDMALFERCIASEFAKITSADVVIIDEIGIIGGWSREFEKFVRRALDHDVPTVAIVRQKSGELSDEVKSRGDVESWTVDRDNRDWISGDIALWVESFDQPTRQS